MSAKQRVLEALLDNVEGYTERDASGVAWGSVYLDNARVAGMSPHAFAGYLSALTAEGQYRPMDDYACGLVRIHRSSTP